jgi:hypothetical protein
MSVPAPVPVPVLVRVFCVSHPAQGPGGETSVKARKGHHAHTLPLGKDWLCRCLLPQGSTTSDGAGSECGDGLELEPLEHLPCCMHAQRTKQTIVVLIVVRFLGLYRGRSVPPGMSPIGEFRAGRHVNGTLLCMPVTPVRRRRRKASASRLRTAEDDDNRRGPGSAWTYVPSHQNARFSRRRISLSS